MSEIRFNLIYDAWIPCRMISNEFKLLSIKDIFLKASEVFEINSNNPLISISLYRLLLAILHRNFGPNNRNEWKIIYESGKFGNKILGQYFEDWHHRFELFNEPENRFYQIQVPEISKKTSIKKLNHAISSGNTSALFSHAWDSDTYPMAVEDATQLLITFQNYAVGGGKSIPFNYSHGPLMAGINVLLKGENLFETLMLNFIRYNQNHPFEKSEDHEDIPFWERGDKSLYEGKEGRYPYGYLDFLTWQGRRIWLIPEIVEGNIIVKEVFMTQGEKIHEDWKLDPQRVYRLDEKNKIVPIKLNPNRQVWRDAEALLRINDLTKSNKTISSKSINWVSILAQKKIIPSMKRYNLEIYGLLNDSKNAAKILNWNRSYIPLPTRFLEDPSYVDNIKSFIENCEKIERALNRTLYFFGKDYLFPSSTKLSTNQNNKVRDFILNYQIQVKYWSHIESYFYKFMAELAQEASYDERLLIIKNYINQKIIKTGRELLDSVKRNIKNDPRALKPYIQNIGHFFKQIHDLQQ